LNARGEKVRAYLRRGLAKATGRVEDRQGVTISNGDRVVRHDEHGNLVSVGIVTADPDPKTTTIQVRWVTDAEDSTVPPGELTVSNDD
jgi:hypothetical protein